MIKIEAQGRRSCGVGGEASDLRAYVRATGRPGGGSVCDDCEVGCRTSAAQSGAECLACSKSAPATMNQDCQPAGAARV